MKIRYIAALVILGGQATSRDATAASDRHAFFISDTHFGVGHVRDSKKWDSYEDARWPQDLSAFVSYVEKTGGGRADLVVNGDTFELWQSREVSCQYQGDRETGCSTTDARLRLERVLAEHSGEMKILGDFARKGANRLFFVVGNHDVALLLPGMEALVREALHVPDTRFQMVVSGVWESDDHLLMAEHGHEIPTDPNAFPNWPHVVIKRKQIDHVPRPWGEQFVQEFYNQFESTYPAIDNFTSDGAGIGYALQAEGVVGSAMGVASFLKFLAFRQSWKQFGQVLGGEGESPQWDLASERKKGSRFLVESFPQQDGVRRAVVASNAVEIDKFVGDRRMLSDAEISEICDARWERAKLGESIASCEGSLGGDDGTLGAVGDSILRKRDARIRAHLAALKKTPRLFIYSHTHAADRFEIPDPGIAIFNTGAWQRLITKEEFEKRLVGRKRAIDVFRALTPDDLEPCYTFVSVPPYAASSPKGALMAWRRADSTKSWVATDKPCH